MTADSAPRRTNDFNETIIEEFRANRGHVGGPWEGTPLLLLHHIGAKSGRERVTPLGYFPQADGQYVIVASNGGSRAHPSWYYNLQANPRIEVEVGRDTYTVRATELDHSARAALWPSLVERHPSLREFEAKTTRLIPVLVLTRENEHDLHRVDDGHRVHGHGAGQDLA